MNKSLGLSVIALSLGLVLAACGPDGGDDQVECVGQFLPGDLVITEIMANPPGDDSGAEWFEVYNATGAPADLTGLVLVSSREDMTDEKTHTMSEIVVAPGDYVVLGGVLQEFAPPHVDYGYGNDLGNLRNTAGRIALRCGTREVDAVIYGTMDDGIAQGFDGGQDPNSTANDNLDNWCPATMEYTTGSFGSPGSANEVCPGLATTCNDNGTDRDIVNPVVGDLVINEVLANVAGADDNKEWFEVYVVNDVDLNGMQMGRTALDVEDSVESTDCIHVTAGSYLVFAQSTDSGVNGELPQVDFVFDFGAALGNANGALWIGDDNAVVDAVTWTNAPEGSMNLDPDFQNPTDNDDAANWCDTTMSTYGTANTPGSPGAANEQCPTIVPAGMCLDGSGTLRSIVKPGLGELVITEIMPDPAAVGDTVGEYFEVRANANVDLNGLEMGRTAPTVDNTFTSNDCVPLASGSYAVFARSTVSANNGMIPGVVGETGFALSNDPGSMFIGIDGGVLDSHSWTMSPTGSSLALDETNTIWCETTAAETYGAGDHGTPGAVNTLANLLCP